MNKLSTRLLASLQSAGANPHTRLAVESLFPLAHVARDVEVRRTEKGLGLFAREPLAPDTDVFLLPAQFAVTNHDMHGMAKGEENRFRAKLETHTRAALQQFTPNTDPILNLMVGVCQLAAGLADQTMPHSRFCLHALHTPLQPLPVFYPRDAADLLVGSATHQKLRAQATTIDLVHAELVAKHLPGLDRPTFLQLFNFVRSRFLNLQPELPDTKYDPLVLCPLLDLANHSPNPNCRLHPYFDRIYDESVFALRTNRDICSGEELELSYGSWGRLASA